MTSPVNETPRLSPSQREEFERNGFLVLRGALNPQAIEPLIAVVDRLDEQERAQKNLAPDATVEIRNAIASAPELLPLLDHPTTFPLMVEILGWNIQLTTSHVFVRTPSPKVEASFKAIGWHCDGPNPGFPAVHGTLPRLYAKIGYFLTDLSRPDMGNLRVVPGSHLKAAPPERDENDEPIGAIQVLTNPGDAVLFEQRLWHAVGPNYASHARKNVYIGYCYRWMKAIDFATQSEELLSRANPIQRQLLGDASDALSFYLPERYPGDTPLKEWTQELPSASAAANI